MALLDGRSQADKAFDDTLVRKAEGVLFDELVDMYGVPRVSWVHERYWRNAARNAIFAKRDSLGSLFGVVREGLRGLDEPRAVKVDPAQGTNKLYRNGGSLFAPDDLFRLWEVDGVVYFSTGWNQTGGTACLFKVVIDVSGWDPSWVDGRVDIKITNGFGTVLAFVRYGHGSGYGSDLPVTSASSPSDIAEALAFRLPAGIIFSYTPGDDFFIVQGPAPGWGASELYSYIGLDQSTAYAGGISVPALCATFATPTAYSPPADPTALILSPYSSPHWAAANWTTLSGSWTTYTAKKLPFLLRGMNGVVEVIAKDYHPLPPTYLQNAHVFKDSAGGSGPLAPIVMLTTGVVENNEVLTDFALSDQQTMVTSLTAPLSDGDTVAHVLGTAGLVGWLSIGVSFKVAGKTFTFTGYTDNTLTGCTQTAGADGTAAPAGSTVEIVNAVPVRGGDYVATLYVNGVASLVVTLTDGTVSAINTSDTVQAVKGDTLSVVVTTPGATERLVAPTASVTGQRPYGEPLGGHLLGDAKADDPATGPWPIYLGGDRLDSEWISLLDNLVAFGVGTTFRKVLHLNNE